MSQNTQAIVDELSRRYTSEAHVYERVWATGLRDVGRRLLETVEFSSARPVLDVGSGVGALLPDLAAAAPGALVVGTDRARGMASAISSQFARAVIDGSRLAFKDETFGAVTMMFVLFHLPDPADGLAEAHRVLTPGGVIAIATWSEADDSWGAMEMWSELLDEFGADPLTALLSQHELVGTPEKMTALLTAAGFGDVKSWFEPYVREWDQTSFEDFATGMAIPKRRWDSLSPDRQSTFLEAARPRLAALGPDAFVHRHEVVLTTAACWPG